MSVTVAPMPGKKRATGAAPTTAVRVEADLAEKINFVCMDRSVNVTDYLTPMLREQVERDYNETLERRYKASKKPIRHP